MIATAYDNVPEARWGLLGVGETAPSHWRQGTLNEAVAEAESVDGSAAYIQLLKDVTTTEKLVFHKEAVMDLNGKTLTGGDGEYNIIEVWNGGNLTLVDSSSTEVASQGRITGEGRTETDGPNPDSGGGVYVSDGTFTMNGGTITGNHIRNAAGGGVYVGMNSTFTMNGGAITGNNGSGVAVLDESAYPTIVNLNGGVITGNEGGGILIGVNQETSRNITVNVSGGMVIQDNYDWGEFENGIYVAGDGSREENLYLSDGASPIRIAGGGLTAGASIGITTYDVPTAETAVVITEKSSADYSSYLPVTVRNMIL